MLKDNIPAANRSDRWAGSGKYRGRSHEVGVRRGGGIHTMQEGDDMATYPNQIPQPGWREMALKYQSSTNNQPPYYPEPQSIQEMELV
jgi:hypothetical protein